MLPFARLTLLCSFRLHNATNASTRQQPARNGLCGNGMEGLMLWPPGQKMERDTCAGHEKRARSSPLGV